jgi:hypothetical protein
VDARLSAYADGSRWAIVIEHLHVNPRSSSFAGTGIAIRFHGNCIDLTGEHVSAKYPCIRIENIMADGPSGPLLEDDWSEEIAPSAKDVCIRGTVVPTRTDENYYWARAIDACLCTNEQIDAWIEAARGWDSKKDSEEVIRRYEEMRKNAGKFKLRTWHLVRGLVPEYRELLLATEEERRRGIPQDLPLVLRLDDWEHPRLLEGEMPSQSASFRRIARVLEKRDPTLWELKQGEGNVHWKHWPNSGNL